METKNGNYKTEMSYFGVLLLVTALVGLSLTAGPVSAETVAYIYSTAPADANNFRELLEDNGFSTELIHINDVPGMSLVRYGLIIAGCDTGSGYQWGNPQGVGVIQESGRPVLGLGRGGAALFQEMDLSINYGHSMFINGHSMYVVEPNHPVFTTPNDITIPPNRIIQLYQQSVEILTEYRPSVSAQVVFLGRAAEWQSYYPLVQEDKHALLGFPGGPAIMTQVGKDLFINLVTALIEPGAVLYGVNSGDDSLSRVDCYTGETEIIGPLDPDPEVYKTPVAMAVRDSDAKIFVWDNSAGTLLTVDPRTARATRVNLTTPNQGFLQALAFGPDGNLYGLDTSLYSIGIRTGAKTLIANLSGHRVMGADLAFGKILYGLTFDRRLLTIDPATGQIARTVNLSENVGTPGSLAFDPVGNKLIGSAFDGPYGKILFDIDPTEGGVSNIRQIIGGSTPQGMDFALPPPPPLSISLNVEDALEGVPVNKVAGDGAGPAGSTILEIVTKLTSYSSSAKNDIPVVLSIYGDTFGAPTNTWVRKYSGSELAAVSCTSLGDGQYQVTTSLDPVFWPWPLSKKVRYYTKQIVWRFLIPNSLSPQDVFVSAQIQQSCADPYASGTVRILAQGSVRTLIITNRQLLYENHSDSSVNALLQRVFTEAQGFPATHSPVGVVYYVDRYSSKARNWDNMNVNYASDATANDTADAVDDLIEDWDDDAAQHITIYIPFIGNISFRLSGPAYLLIVGDDNTIPLYRYNDPSNDEGINVRTSCPAADGWCVDSATNPHINATDHDYILTDNPYGDLWGGTDWKTGDLELCIGRILGETAADMLSLLEEGVDWNNGDRGGVVMASVAGWELGLEPDDGQAGEIADLHDVPALFRGKGFAVRNDNVPSSEVRTIDVMSPYEGGNNSWNTNFTNAANNSGGMDLFFIGGHNSYDHAGIPGDNFSPDDTPTKYTRFGTDHPIAMITGCHGGLPVPDIDVDGGVDHCMVYDLIHEGARAYIGATGFSYGSPGNLHKCTWAERLMQRFFDNLLKPPGGNSMAIGKALTEAKDDYVFGFGSKDALDRKTVTEFNLFGVPWSFIYYPGGARTTEAGTKDTSLQKAFTTQQKSIASAVEEGVYTQTFDVAIKGYDVNTELHGKIMYDIFSVPGGDTAIAPGVPVLPFVNAYDLILPFAGNVTKVQILDQHSERIGQYNIPIAVVEPWSEEGLTYTTKTDIDYPYPVNADLVQYQQTGDSLAFTVFPIQHNPTSDETTFYSYFLVQITYESPLPVAVTDFATDKDIYLPGETIQTQAQIHNVIEESVSLTAALVIKNTLGQEVCSSGSFKPFTVGSGASFTLNLSCAPGGDLPDGPYTAELSLFRGQDFVGGASDEFTVRSGEIKHFAVPTTLHVHQVGRFDVTFANYRDSNVAGLVSMTVQDNAGGLTEDLPPQLISVPGNSSKTASFAWMPLDAGSGNFSATAIVAASGQKYGPESKSFDVSACACIGDLAEPLGQVDLQDLDAMVNLLVSAGPPFIVPVEPGHCGDFDESGQVDLRDLDALVNLLVNAGPPFIVPCE